MRRIHWGVVVWEALQLKKGFLYQGFGMDGPGEVCRPEPVFNEAFGFNIPNSTQWPLPHWCSWLVQVLTEEEVFRFGEGWN